MSDISSGEKLFAEKESRVPSAIMYSLIVILVGLLIFYFFISYSPINGDSMENTIFEGQSVVLQRRGYTLRRSDIVTVDVSEKNDGSHNIIKRVIGIGGDRILFVRSQNTRNVNLYLCRSGESHFLPVDEPYIKEPMRASVSYGDYALLPYVAEQILTAVDVDTESDDAETEQLRNSILNASVTVPKSRFFFLGDNRNNSSDSRRYGTQPTDKIIGKVLTVLDKNSGMERFMRLLFGLM